MAKGKKQVPVKKGRRGFDIRALIFLILLAIGILVSVSAALQPTKLENFAVKCSLDNCNQCNNGSYWVLKNVTNCPAEPDGDQQTCSYAGKLGLCGGKWWCCATGGGQWTQTLTACANSTYLGPCIAPATPTPAVTNTPVPTATTRPTATPYPTYTPYPTTTPYPTSTGTPRPTATPRIYVTSTPRPTTTPRPTVTPTPTPVPLLSEACGRSCVTDSDCKLGLGCTTIFAMLRACRNKSCPDKPGCLCSDSASGDFSYATPTPGPQGSGSLRTLVLTVGTFTDAKRQTTQTPTISGISEPDAKVTVTVYPDGIGGEVYADKTGKWSFTFTKKLNPGQKNLLVVATKPDGQAQASQQFTVVGSSGSGNGIFGWILLLMILSAVGFGIYVYVKSNQ